MTVAAVVAVFGRRAKEMRERFARLPLVRPELYFFSDDDELASAELIATHAKRRADMGKKKDCRKGKGRDEVAVGRETYLRQTLHSLRPRHCSSEGSVLPSTWRRHKEVEGQVRTRHALPRAPRGV